MLHFINWNILFQKTKLSSNVNIGDVDLEISDSALHSINSLAYGFKVIIIIKIQCCANQIKSIQFKQL